jgi:hypothetical protein
MKRPCALLFLLLLLAAAASGQMLARSSFSTGPDGATHGSATFQLPAHMLQPVLGAPYSAEEISEHVQTLASGVHITQTTSRVKEWRDSLGRTRTERPMTHLGRVAQEVPTLIQISDPVAGYLYTLDVEKKVAHRVAASPPPEGSLGDNRVYVHGGVSSVLFAEAAAAAATAQAPKRPAAAKKPSVHGQEVTTETLGTKTIDGVVVEGMRQTTVYATGSQGNDAPFSVVSEDWWSRELRLMLLSTRDDPRSGVETHRFADLSTQEPAQALFMVPGGYTVADETDSFTITWGVQEQGPSQP